MKVILDNIVFSLQKSGGISVVWQNIIGALNKSENKDFISIEYSGAEENIFRKNIILNNIEFRKPRLNRRIERYLNPVVKESKPFIFHSSYYRTSSNKNAINVTTVHDFTYDLYRKGFPKWLHCWQKYRAIRNSDVIVCVSENTKRDLLNYLPDVDPNKIRITLNGVSDIYKKLDPPIVNPYGKYILFVGSRASYKNFELTVNALHGLDYKLVVAGPPLNEREKTFISSRLDPGQCIEKCRISDEKLNVLYNNAYCFAYPSEYEGFGIPVLEAQRAGCPVIAYNASSIPEIIGETPLLLNSSSVSEFREKLQILVDANVRQKIIADGLENSKRFSWQKMGEEYLQLYREIEQNIKS